MARDTAAAALDELFELLVPDGIPAVEGITAAYDHDPGAARIAELAEPVLLTVADAGLTAVSYVFVVRLIFDAEVDAAAAQAAARDIVPAVDELLAAHWGPVEWEYAHSDDLPAAFDRPAWVATTRLDVGREDGRFRPGPSGFGA